MCTPVEVEVSLGALAGSESRVSKAPVTIKAASAPSPQTRPRRQLPRAATQPSAIARKTPAMIPFCRTWVPAATSTRAVIRNAQRRPGRSQSFAAWAIRIAPATAVLANITSFQTMPW